MNIHYTYVKIGMVFLDTNNTLKIQDIVNGIIFWQLLYLEMS